MAYNKDEVKDALELEDVPEISGIYRLYNFVQGKSYVGQSQNLKKRVYQHWHPNNKKIPYIDRVIQENPKDFKIYVLERCNIELLDVREQYWINYYNSFRNGYNLTKGGTLWRGENHPKAKLNQKQVSEIQQLLLNGYSATEIKKEKNFDVSIEQISAINNGYTWRNDNLRYPLSRFAGVKLFSDKQVIDIRLKCYDNRNNLSAVVKQLAAFYKTNPGNIYSIVYGRTYCDIAGPILNKPIKHHFSKEEILYWRKLKSKTNLPTVELWNEYCQENDKKISYGAFKDMINGRTYRDLPLASYNSQQDKKINKYNFILENLPLSDLSIKEFAKKYDFSERTVYRALEWSKEISREVEEDRIQ